MAEKSHSLTRVIPACACVACAVVRVVRACFTVGYVKAKRGDKEKKAGANRKRPRLEESPAGPFNPLT